MKRYHTNRHADIVCFIYRDYFLPKIIIRNSLALKHWTRVITLHTPLGFKVSLFLLLCASGVTDICAESRISTLDSNSSQTYLHSLLHVNTLGETHESISSSLCYGLNSMVFLDLLDNQYSKWVTLNSARKGSIKLCCPSHTNCCTIYYD